MNAFVIDWKRHFGSKCYLPQCQLAAQTHLVCRFQQPRSHLAVNFYGGSINLGGHF
jgi:hypothetical protein